MLPSQKMNKDLVFKNEVTFIIELYYLVIIFEFMLQIAS